MISIQDTFNLRPRTGGPIKAGTWSGGADHDHMPSSTSQWPPTSSYKEDGATPVPPPLSPIQFLPSASILLVVPCNIGFSGGRLICSRLWIGGDANFTLIYPTQQFFFFFFFLLPSWMLTSLRKMETPPAFAAKITRT